MSEQMFTLKYWAYSDKPYDIKLKFYGRKAKAEARTFTGTLKACRFFITDAMNEWRRWGESGQHQPFITRA